MEPDRKSEYASLQRGLQILKVMQNLGRASAADVSQMLDMPLSTVYRYIAILKDSGFAVEVEGALVPSERLAEGWSDTSNLVRLGAPILHRLRTDTDMTGVLAVRVHTAALCLDVSYAHPQHRVSFRRGQMRSLHAGASALPLLAHAPQSIIEEVLTRGYRGYTAATLRPGELAAELERIRRDGYSVSRGQTTPGMYGVGVPVDAKGTCIASLSLVDEIGKPAREEHDLVATLRGAAAQLAIAIANDGYGESL